MRYRVQLALFGVILWMTGVELAPNLHLAMHAHLAPHVHDGDHTIYLQHHDDVMQEHHEDAEDDLDAEVDEHGNPVVAHDDDEAPVHDPRAEHDLAMRLEHGAHSLAHHAVALHPAAPPQLAPLPFHRYTHRLAIIAIIEPRSFSVPEAAARGPPLPLA